MSLITDLLVASSSEAEAVANSASRAQTWPCFESKGLDNSTLAALWSALEPGVDSSSLEGEGNLIFVEGSEGPWVFKLPTPFVSGLAALQAEAVHRVAERWVKQPELAHARWQASDVAPAIEAIQKVAVTAVQSEKDLLLWMAL